MSDKNKKNRSDKQEQRTSEFDSESSGFGSSGNGSSSTDSSRSGCSSDNCSD